MAGITTSDSAGNPLHVGSYVVYAPTGTKGKVTEFLSDEHGAWALVDKTDLFYKTDVLTAIDEEKKDERGEKSFTREEINEVLEKQREAAPDQMDDTSLESGG
ncbi:MAG: DUF2098 domain-containing protein [Candidatus Methanoperedens sp.]|jgi:hypothetical protein|nr:DUF2098 domain-containing protein [Candidatus Methanoperedens sp.]PKL53581.1 MAG: DUF2098 domain-containing protein [Candidatus Methanoperedenaceae archaeon HGW-Methanoperedenaceae-1]